MNGVPHAVLLAGGDGARLLPLTRRIYGDDRPKQFCPLVRKQTLLAQTRSRIAPLFPPGATFYSVVEAHHRYYEAELADVQPTRILVQPGNRGTSAAIAYSLLRIPGALPDEIVFFFPTDHHFADEAAFREAVEIAVKTVRQHPDFLVLLGAPAESADADYGWIEPGCSVGDASTSSVRRVRSFWEKPSASIAAELHTSGCLLNTFVMCGRAGVFLELLESAAPRILRPFSLLPEAELRERKALRQIYRNLPVSDFSHHVLSSCANRLLVVRLAGAGWSDLGTEARVNAVMAREGSARAEPHNLEAFHTWLAAYRKRLAEVTGRSASAGAGFPK